MAVHAYKFFDEYFLAGEASDGWRLLSHATDGRGVPAIDVKPLGSLYERTPGVVLFYPDRDCPQLRGRAGPDLESVAERVAEEYLIGDSLARLGKRKRKAR